MRGLQAGRLTHHRLRYCLACQTLRKVFEISFFRMLKFALLEKEQPKIPLPCQNKIFMPCLTPTAVGIRKSTSGKNWRTSAHRFL